MSLMNSVFLVLTFTGNAKVEPGNPAAELLLIVFGIVCTLTLVGVIFVANKYYFSAKALPGNVETAEFSLIRTYFYLILLSGGIFITMVGFILMSYGVYLPIAAVFAVMGQLLFFYLFPKKSFLLKREI